MKKCPKCQLDLTKDQFGKNSAKKDGLQTHCKECRKAINNQHYKNSPNRREAVRRNTRVLKEKNIEYLNAVKANGCIKCGEKEVCALEFHHLNQDKDFDIARKKDRYSLVRIKSEVEKCIVVCANCHRKIHAGIIHE